MVEPVGSFVLLQPLVIGVQGLEVRSPQVPPFSREEHHQVTRSITLPETFVNEVDDSLFMNDSITNVPSSESPSLMEVASTLKNTFVLCTFTYITQSLLKLFIYFFE